MKDRNLHSLIPWGTDYMSLWHSCQLGNSSPPWLVMSAHFHPNSTPKLAHPGRFLRFHSQASLACSMTPTYFTSLPVTILIVGTSMSYSASCSTGIISRYPKYTVYPLAYWLWIARHSQGWTYWKHCPLKETLPPASHPWLFNRRWSLRHSSQPQSLWPDCIPISCKFCLPIRLRVHVTSDLCNLGPPGYSETHTNLRISSHLGPLPSRAAHIGLPLQISGPAINTRLFRCY